MVTSPLAPVADTHLRDGGTSLALRLGPQGAGLAFKHRALPFNAQPLGG